MQFPIVFRITCLLLLTGAIVSAQPRRQPIFNHSLTVEQRRPIVEPPPSFVLSAPETTNVLVALVAFQEDNNPGTTGNGSFDTSSALKRIIDPPPHNRAYVQNHMTFLENYFRKVSDGKHIVKARVLDSVYRVSHEMAYYSPPRTSSNNTELGRLMIDAWEKVDSVTPGISYEKYQAFVIVHAGVGKDVDLVSLYGYDPAPFDLPSLYLNLAALKKMFGSSYQGVRVGDTVITNSIIIPETESRYLPTITGTALLPLGINGLLAASFGSYLGLPDLFDTKTGRSGIGRFGLMDGQSIFSWNGLFPPEPSAWEKYFLRWIDPIPVSSGDTVYSFPAVGINHAADTVYRVPISAKEYFLVENRNRDANLDSAKITVVFNGDTTVRRWARDTTGFNALFQDSLYGVVTDVDEFDWSLPGGVDRTREWFDGGLLIWHIDENVIDANYAIDAVNADPKHRGVDLEEADGMQDIGQAYAFLTPGSGSEDGTQYDYWYAGNQAPLRLVRNGNAFTPTSHPSSESNDRANSHIYIKDFSERAPRMTARIQVGDEQVKPLAGFPKTTNNTFSTFGKNSVRYSDSIVANSGTLLAAKGNSIHGWGVDGNTISGFNSSGEIAFLLPVMSGTFIGTPVVGDFNGDHAFDFAMAGTERLINPPPLPFVSAWSMKDVNHDSLADDMFSLQTNPLANLTTSLISGDSVFAIGNSQNEVTFISHSGMLLDSVRLSPNDSTPIVGVSLWSKPDEFIALSSSGVIGLVKTPSTVVISKNFYRRMTSSAAAGTISSNLGKKITFATQDGYIYLVDSILDVTPGFPVATGGEILNSPALADIDGDGQKDIVVFSGNKIYAINATGAILDNFPITVSTTNTILTSPIVADVDGNGTVDIVAVTQGGLVVAYDKSGKMVGGFPIQAGINGGSTPAAFYLPSSNACLSCTDIGLAVASDDGNVYAWRTGTLQTGLVGPPKQPWPQFMHDAQNTGLDETSLTIKPKNNEFFPTSQAYNWPNPVGAEQGFKTHIRYFVHDNANVTITIFDLAGDLVTQFKGPGVGGLDNEIDWDVSAIQSGIYFAHIQAQGTSTTGSAVIKIAVVK